MEFSFHDFIIELIQFQIQPENYFNFREIQMNANDIRTAFNSDQFGKPEVGKQNRKITNYNR